MAARRTFATLTILTAAALGAVGAAWSGALWVEARSLDAVRAVLARHGADWAAVEADGLRLVLTGTAPDEPARLRAVAAASGVVDPARIVDAMGVAQARALAPPRFSLEILRNLDSLSLIGLVPAHGTRAALDGALGDFEVTDMVETADRAVPAEQAATWEAALGFALDAVDDLPRSKVSVSPARVEITAVAEDDAARRTLEARLVRAAPDGVALVLDVQAPRPVIAPFTTRFAIAGGRAQLEACAVDDEAARVRVVTAAVRAGFEGEADCVVALGAPSSGWADAVAAGIDAVAALDGGSVTLSDADVTLVGPDGVAPAAFAEASAALDAALPDLFVLTAVRPEPELSDVEAVTRGIPDFVATRSPEGDVTMRGRLRDEGQEAAVAAFGRAVLGHGDARLAATLDEAVPDGWPVRVLAGIEALSSLSSGVVTVRPDRVTLRGRTGDRQGEAEVSRLLAAKLGEDADFRVEVAYDERLDPTLAIPTPAQCVERLAEAQAGAKLSFAPGEAVIEATSAGVLGDLVSVLRDCDREVFEVGGHTDSQGRETMNEALSAGRAEAVRAALIERGVAPSQLVARGYGEAEPIADNDTEAGRELNRRIVFTLAGGGADEVAAATAPEAVDGDAPAVDTGAVAPEGAETPSEE